MTEQALNDEERDRLSAMLGTLGDGHAMNLEMLDGFFCALICGPDLVMPSEYLPEIWGARMTDVLEIATEADLQEFLSLIRRHWNSICVTLQSDDIYLPILLEDDDGFAPANDWANGFMRGMEMRRDGWAALINDEEQFGVLIPVFALAYEHDPDPEMRPYAEPMDVEVRETLIAGAAAGITEARRYFQAQERAAELRFREASQAPRRSAGRAGRNAPCPCGSGKKFKQCCAGLTIH